MEGRRWRSCCGRRMVVGMLGMQQRTCFAFIETELLEGIGSYVRVGVNKEAKQAL